MFCLCFGIVARYVEGALLRLLAVSAFFVSQECCHDGKGFLIFIGKYWSRLDVLEYLFGVCNWAALT